MDSVFFILAKLIGALLRPDSWLIILVLLSCYGLWRGRRRLAGRSLLIVAIGLIVLAIVPVGHMLLAPLEARFPPRPKLTRLDKIILLGGAEDRTSTMRWHQAGIKGAGDRYLAVIELAYRFPKADIYFSGGETSLVGKRVSESSIARDILLAAGIAERRLHFEASARNTAENATKLKKRVEGKEGEVTVLVTSASHMPRAIASFCAAGLDRLVAWPTDYRSGIFDDSYGWELADNLNELNHAAHEWAGLLAYRVTGRTQSFLGDHCQPPASSGSGSEPKPKS